MQVYSSPPLIFPSYLAGPIIIMSYDPVYSCFCYFRCSIGFTIVSYIYIYNSYNSIFYSLSLDPHPEDVDRRRSIGPLFVVGWRRRVTRFPSRSPWMERPHAPTSRCCRFAGTGRFCQEIYGCPGLPGDDKDLVMEPKMVRICQNMPGVCANLKRIWRTERATSDLWHEHNVLPKWHPSSVTKHLKKGSGARPTIQRRPRCSGQTCKPFQTYP